MKRMLRRTWLSLLFAGSMYLPAAVASDLPGLRAVGENGMELCLDRSTVDSFSIGKNVHYAMPGTEDAPTFAIELKLNELAGEAFARLTAANVKKKLQYWLNGRLLWEGTVLSDILGGVVLIVVDTEAEALAAVAEAEKLECSRNQRT